MEIKIPPGIPSLLLNFTETVGADEQRRLVMKVVKPAVIEEPIYIRQRLKLTCDNKKDNHLEIKWVTISQAEAEFENLEIQGLVHCTGEGTLIARNCTFTPSDQQPNTAVEVFAQSKCIFENCVFSNAIVCPLTIRDRASFEIINCTFHLNTQTSLLILESAKGFVNKSTFLGTDKFSVYVFSNSQCEFNECKFSEIAGKGAYVFKNSEATFNKCRFEKIKGGAINCSTDGTTIVDNCTFSGNGHSGVHAQFNCKTQIKNSTFTSSGIIYEYCGGLIDSCTFTNMNSPGVCCLGYKSNPAVKNCKIKTYNNFGIVIRDAANPSLYNISLESGKTHAIMISDFSSPRIAKTTINNCLNTGICIVNGANPEINNCIINSCKKAIEIMTTSSPLIQNCIINGDILIHHRGELLPTKFIGNVKNSENSSFKSLIYQDGMFSIGEEAKMPQEEPDFVEIPEMDIGNLDLSCESKSEHKQMCMICHKEEAELACVPCGHILICHNCKDSFEKSERKKKVCPICSTPVLKLVNVFQEQECQICCDSKADTMILPCGHFEYCYKCAVRACEVSKICPTCRGRVISIRHMFPTV